MEQLIWIIVIVSAISLSHQCCGKSILLENGSLITSRKVNRNEAPMITVQMADSEVGKTQKILGQTHRLITVGNPIVSQKLSSSNNNRNIVQTNPHCMKPGYIPDPYDCTKFFNCLVISSGFQIISLNCVTGTVFEKSEFKCIPEMVATSCSNTSTAEEAPQLDYVVKNTAQVFEGSSNTQEDVVEDGVQDEYEQGIQMDDELIEQPFSSSSRGEFAEFIHPQVGEDVEEFDPKLSEFKTNSILPELKQTKIIATHHSSPNAWFGLVKTNGKPGNPFREDETSLAVILDFSTSRLQIYSRNLPTK